MCIGRNGDASKLSQMQMSEQHPRHGSVDLILFTSAVHTDHIPDKILFLMMCLVVVLAIAQRLIRFWPAHRIGSANTWYKFKRMLAHKHQSLTISSGFKNEARWHLSCTIRCPFCFCSGSGVGPMRCECGSVLIAR